MDDEITSSAVENELTKPTFDMSKLPKKPPRQHSSSSDTQLVSEDDTGDLKERRSVFFDDLNDSASNRRHVPPLPRKPTCLRKSAEPAEALTSTFYTDLPGEKEDDGESKEISLENQRTTPKERTKMLAHSNSQLEQSLKPISYLKSNAKNFAAGCTPPLPRKPARRQPPVPNQVADSTKKESLEMAESNRKIDGGNIVGSDSRSPLDKRRILMPPSFEMNTDIGNDVKRRSSEPDQTDSGNSKVVSRGNVQLTSVKGGDQESERRKIDERTVKQTSTERSRLSRQTPLFNRPLPPLVNHGSIRRPPPGLPKQPSLERKRRSEPPPLPNSPRPVSIVRGNAVKIKPFRRSQSEGKLFDSFDEEGKALIYLTRVYNLCNCFIFVERM